MFIVLLEAEVSWMGEESADVSVNRWRGTELNIRAQVVAAIFADLTFTAWYSRFYGHTITCRTETGGGGERERGYMSIEYFEAWGSLPYSFFTNIG